MASGVDASQAIEILSAARGLPVPETEGQLLWIQKLAEMKILRPTSAVTLHKRRIKLPTKATVNERSGISCRAESLSAKHW